MLEQGYTHVCLCTIDDPEGFCNTFLKLSRLHPKDPKSVWVSSPAVEHMRKNHPNSSAGGAAAARAASAKDALKVQQFMVGVAGSLPPRPGHCQDS